MHTTMAARINLDLDTLRTLAVAQLCPELPHTFERVRLSRPNSAFPCPAAENFSVLLGRPDRKRFAFH